MPSVPPDPFVLMLMATPLRYYSRQLGAMIVPRIAGGRTSRDQRALRNDLDHRQTHPPSLVGYAHQLYASTGVDGASRGCTGSASRRSCCTATRIRSCR